MDSEADLTGLLSDFTTYQMALSSDAYESWRVAHPSKLDSFRFSLISITMSFGTPRFRKRSPQEEMQKASYTITLIAFLLVTTLGISAKAQKDLPQSNVPKLPLPSGPYGVAGLVSIGSTRIVQQIWPKIGAPTAN